MLCETWMSLAGPLAKSEVNELYALLTFIRKTQRSCHISMATCFGTLFDDCRI